VILALHPVLDGKISLGDISIRFLNFENRVVDIAMVNFLKESDLTPLYLELNKKSYYAAETPVRGMSWP